MTPRTQALHYMWPNESRSTNDRGLQSCGSEVTVSTLVSNPASPRSIYRHPNELRPCLRRNKLSPMNQEGQTRRWSKNHTHVECPIVARLTVNQRVSAAQRAQTSHPESKTMRQVFCASKRQIEVYLPISLPVESCTGPLLSASRPESNTSTVSGSQEKGALGPS